MTRKGTLNVRNQPGENSSIICKLEKGDSVIIQKNWADWYEVKISDAQIGYCKGVYIDLRSAEEIKIQTAISSRHFNNKGSTRTANAFQDFIKGMKS